MIKYNFKETYELNENDRKIVEKIKTYTADNDLLNEVVSMMAETTIYSEVKKDLK